MIEQYLRVVRTMIDSLPVNLDQALEMAQVPEAERDAVRARYEEETALPIRRASIISERGGPRQWFEDWDPSTGYYWRLQRQYLMDHVGWSTANVESLDDASDMILSHLEDPRPNGPEVFDIRGLVMGYVQSGKTANFCALIAKAADAGYKLVIVLSGIHNSLRLQTQRRVNRVLGIGIGGVPTPEPGRRWIALTSADLDGDFRPGTIDANVLQGNERVLIVCKKNASVLRRLTAWMKDRAPSNLPVLIIDDEADQASINTGGNRVPPQEESDLEPGDIDNPEDQENELDPSTINGLIRQLIVSFSRISYVAYTATPFANVLIDHQALDSEVQDSLYPRDFIVSLPIPNGYTGAERLFGRVALAGESEDQPGLEVIRTVPDYEAELLSPRSRDVDTYDPAITPSLREAFLDFVLATSARIQRANHDLPATMLVHTHYRQQVQNLLGDKIRDLVAEIRQAWRYDRQTIKPELQNRWEQKFRPLSASIDIRRDITFDDLEDRLDSFFRERIPVLVLNSSSNDVLDYEADPRLKAVVVGGNRLSRGLTLEGLLVSYYIRRAGYYDALMQMGRWFGFREDYVDLTRIWTTTELASWFRDLSAAEEDLRREIGRYQRERLTPRDFGPRIRRHPAMMITAKNKMGSAEVVEQNYSGHLIQTTSFRLNEKSWLENNLKAGSGFIKELGAPNHTTSRSGRFVWSGVAWRDVDRFLADYWLDPSGPHVMEAIRQYIAAQVNQEELIDWVVGLIGLGAPDQLLGVEPMFTICGEPVNRIRRTQLKFKPNDIGSLVNPAVKSNPAGSGDEEIGLSREQLEEARGRANGKLSFPKALRMQRSPRQGLLLLYPISPYSMAEEGSKTRISLFENPDRDGLTVLGAAMAFPYSDSAATIEYVVGSAGASGDGTDDA